MAKQMELARWTLTWVREHAIVNVPDDFTGDLDDAVCDYLEVAWDGEVGETVDSEPWEIVHQSSGEV